MKIPQRLYHRMLGSLPLLCVDGVIRNANGQVLLVKRANEPLKNTWWVPGGRVLKGETIERAFHRKMREELGIRITNVRCVGFFEAVKMSHRALDDYGGQLHSLSIVFQARCNADNVTLDSQSSDWGYFDKLPARFKIQPFGAESPV